MEEKDTNKTSLLNRWKNRKKEEGASTNIITKVATGIKIPLSYGQKRLWFLQQMYPSNPFYNYSETYTFDGELKETLLIESLQSVYNDHDILRTTFHIEDGEIYQKVDANAKMDIAVHDLSSLNKMDSEKKSLKVMEADAFKYFNLERSPLVRASLIKINPVKHILQITLHHIVTDKWSMRVFREQLSNYYQSNAVISELSDNKAKMQYADYAYWLNKKAINSEHFDYWKQKLSGEIPNLNLPTDYTKPLQPSFKGAASSTQNFGKEFSTKILDLATQLETTPFNLMLSVYYIFLYRYSGQKDILIGTPVTNRDSKELEKLIGFFNDTMVLRTVLNDDMSFTELLNHVKKNHLEAFKNKDIHFDYLVRELKVDRSLAINPFFQVMFLYHSVPENPSFGENLNLSHTWFDLKVSKFDLTIYVAEENGILSSTFEYASDLFHESTVERFQGYFKTLLEGIVANPNENIVELPMLPSHEKKFLLGQKEKTKNHFSEYSGIHEIIENISKSNPETIAVTYKDTTITYKQLNKKANVVAHNLAEYIKSDNEVIGLCIDRSVDMIIGMLAILKTGCAYLPIDPDYPKERIDFMLKDAQVKTIVNKQNVASLFLDNALNQIQIDSLDYTPGSNITNVSVSKPSNLAYIIYTSGSTGQPKGVPITHKNIINSTGGRLDFYNEKPTAFLLMSSISFDSSKAGIFWTLCTGGNLVIAEKRIEQDIEKIGNLVKKQSISHTLMLPSLYKLMLQYIDCKKLNSLKTVIVAGEACNNSLCENHFEKLPNASLYNEYGPTEASVWCIAHKIVKENSNNINVPIGKPVANAEIYLLDEKLNLVPIGSVGEIYIGGVGLTKGYINRPDLNKNAFINNPFNNSKKIYKTGDLGKLRHDNTIEFLGRADQQIKIRGYRVELNEIEKVIKNYNEKILDAYVLVETDTSNFISYTDKEIYNLETLIEILGKMEGQDVDSIISSIQTLNNNQKKYLLNQLEA
ncbi:amino acid adenylation domain-containing protein [uncultured Algibacter sp.]|uniref:non-ribosomal peptide synthetase n=1 Tax=uncultured Algibacter sp. TaxID=298659 RepID=UPI00261BB0EF|nr:amino acid adenylation domain-containing protein [uncultured Algibacter sp.]